MVLKECVIVSGLEHRLLASCIFFTSSLLALETWKKFDQYSIESTSSSMHALFHGEFLILDPLFRIDCPFFSNIKVSFYIPCILLVRSVIYAKAGIQLYLL